jgi:amino-acid N-acetyltransferase
VKALLKEADQQQISRVCLFTRIPDFFARLGFVVSVREELPDKIFKDCLACPRLHCCDEVAMVYGEADARATHSYSARGLVQLGK